MAMASSALLQFVACRAKQDALLTRLKTMQWKRSTLTAFVGAIILAGCSRTTPEHIHASEKAPPVRVAAARVERRDLARSSELAADFRPYQEVDVHAKVAGYLKTITVDV